jgi:hypothetical protein
MFMDWSDETNGEINRKLFSNYPSSDATSQVNYQPTFTANTWGDTMAVRVKSLAGYNVNIDEHRLTMHWMRMDAFDIL